MAGLCEGGNDPPGSLKANKIGYGEMVFGEMRTRICRRLPDILLTIGENLGKNQTGLLLVDIMPHGTTINSDGFVATLKKLQVRLSRVRRHREKQDVLLLHDNAQPYVSHKTNTRSENSDRQH
ncbi:hypothetical protein ANN_25744 [Periplaneta americana]|uniref:Uncharacterized protein n=1 Tax=Periplaneta americana TaxID=6978 RepID=A0ABQ8S4E6_PERAM|nr:hypothetical protein ANN_25744 [Periplaneta americana]